jgi:CHASE1-domain containing sensor protein
MVHTTLKLTCSVSHYVFERQLLKVVNLQVLSQVLLVLFLLQTIFLTAILFILSQVKRVKKSESVTYLSKSRGK